MKHLNNLLFLLTAFFAVLPNLYARSLETSLFPSDFVTSTCNAANSSLGFSFPDEGDTHSAVLTVTIPYGSALDMNTFSYLEAESFMWVLETSGHEISQGKDWTSLQQVVFDTPGAYDLHLTSLHQPIEGGCNHSHIPDEIKITVSGVRSQFDFSSIDFSSPIVAFQEVKGIKVKVPIKVETYDNQPFEYMYQPVLTAGTATTVQALPTQEKITIQPNTVTYLVYELEGIVSQSMTYIMFDFIDVNNQIQSYNYPKIK